MSNNNPYERLFKIWATISKLVLDGKRNPVRVADHLQQIIDEPKSAPPIAEDDAIIRVDRSVRPSYPNWMKEVVHPELESIGPREYNISEIVQWLHDDQKSGFVSGDMIYRHLDHVDGLKDCLGLRDLEEIQKKGIAFFRKYFKDKTVCGWSGVLRNRVGLLFVPCLRECDDEVVFGWCCTNGDWNVYLRTLRFSE